VAAVAGKSGEPVNEQVDPTPEVAEEVSAIVDQSEQPVAALVEKTAEPVNERVDRRRETMDRERAQWEEFVRGNQFLVGGRLAG
jgi:hypothetical protein